MTDGYDVFLSHNTPEKPIVETIASYLSAQGLKVWLDKWELRPGFPWVEGLEVGVKESRSVAIFIGRESLGDWQEPEMRAFIDRSMRENVPIIPVLLPGCPESPKLTIFLQAFTWVDLRKGLSGEGLASLVWGISGKKPASSTVLSSGERVPDNIHISAPRGIEVDPNIGSQPSYRFKAWPPWERSAVALAITGIIVTIVAGLMSGHLGRKKPHLYGVRIQVLDPEGGPVSDAKVRSSTGNEPHLLPDGWWEIQIPSVKVPLDGKITLWAEQGDWGTNRVDLMLEYDPNASAEIRLKQPETLTIGRVLDEEGNALGGVQIEPQDGIRGRAISQSDGRFEIRLPVPREKRVGLRAELNGWTPDTTYCFAGRDSCPIVLTRR